MTSRHPEHDLPETPADRAFVLRGWPYVLVPLVLVILFEFWFRQTVTAKTFGYDTIPVFAQGRPVDFVFIGSSRTIAAVNEGRFGELVAPELGRPQWGLNQGTGGAKIIYHQFGLRLLYDRIPTQMNRSRILIEAPSGIPDYMLPGDNWVYDGYEHMLTELLLPGDFPGLWRSRMVVGTKLDITFNYLLRNWRSFFRRYGVRAVILETGAARVRDLLKFAGGREREVEQVRINMRGGIMVSRSIIENAQGKFDQWAAGERVNLERPWTDWDNSIVKEIVDLARANGSTVYFFEVPQPTMYKRVWETPERLADREVFRAAAARWGVPILKPDLATTDQDFPDNFHLGDDQAQTYTERLAEEYLGTLAQE